MHINIPAEPLDEEKKVGEEEKESYYRRGVSGLKSGVSGLKSGVTSAAGAIGAGSVSVKGLVAGGMKKIVGAPKSSTGSKYNY